MTKAKSMPTVRQLIAMYVEQAVEGLEDLLTIRCNDADWVDVDVDVDQAMGLALIRARQLKEIDLDAGSFDLEWFRVKAAISLSAKCFSRPDSYYWRRLKGVDELFTHAVVAVDYAAKRGAKEA